MSHKPRFNLAGVQRPDPGAKAEKGQGHFGVLLH